MIADLVMRNFDVECNIIPAAIHEPRRSRLVGPENEKKYQAGSVLAPVVKKLHLSFSESLLATPGGENARS
jgi:hypothetical protein